MAKNEKDYINEIAELKAEIDAFQMSENEANEIIAELKAENERLKREITELEEKFLTLNGKSYSYYTTLQEIKGVITALYMNNWLQMNETARKSIQLLQELITKAEEE